MKPKFYRKILENGMAIIFEKRETPAVSVAFAVRAGGINESSHEKGICHFIEHMLYKGTKNRSSRKIAEEIEKKGGILNGFTDETVTAYWCKMPSKYLDTALNVLSDIVKNPLFNKEEVEKERQVIFEEIKMYKDSPAHHVLNEIQRSLYKEPFGMPLIGTSETLNSLTRERLIDRFNQIYQPKNMILCVVGDADFRRIVDFAKKNFFETKKGRKKISRFKTVKKNSSKIEKRKGIDQANLVFAYHVPTLKNKKNHAARILSVLMSGGMSSRLFHEIREKRNLAYVVKGSSEISKDFAHNVVYIGTKKENVEKVKKIILDEFEKVSKELSENELRQVKEEVIGNLHISMEDSQSQMAYLLHYEIEGNAKNFYEIEKNIRSVKLKDVKTLAREARKKHSFFGLVPE